MLQCSKDLSDTSLTAMSRDQDMLDVFGFRGCKLFAPTSGQWTPSDQADQQVSCRAVTDFYLGSPFDGLLEVCRHRSRSRLGVTGGDTS